MMADGFLVAHFMDHYTLCLFMAVSVAQLGLEHQIVDLRVAGSNPVTHPLSRPAPE